MLAEASGGQLRAAFDFQRATSAVQAPQARSFLAVKLDKSFLPQAGQNVCPSKETETRVARQPHTCVQWNSFFNLPATLPFIKATSPVDPGSIYLNHVDVAKIAFQPSLCRALKVWS